MTFAPQPVGLASLLADLPTGYLAVFQTSRKGNTLVSIGYKSKDGRNVFKSREIDLSIATSPKADESMVLMFKEAFAELRREINQIGSYFEDPG
jgi:hypothetical protein